jgi:hypothetical protein
MDLVLGGFDGVEACLISFSKVLLSRALLFTTPPTGGASNVRTMFLTDTLVGSAAVL